MFYRGQNTEQIPLNIVGSSTFGRYPVISVEKTLNMLISDGWLVPYPGYEVAASYTQFPDNSSSFMGRAIYASEKLNALIIIIGPNVYKVHITFNQLTKKSENFGAQLIGTLFTSSGPVYISENNASQILISDNQRLYLYTASNNAFTEPAIDFQPGYIDFQNTYFICACILFEGSTNIWRLSESNDGSTWPVNNEGFSSALETKPDRIQACVRFPSLGNFLLVLGRNVGEPWFNIANGALFPYQRNASYNIDYGCLNPQTIAALDKFVVWLAVNEKSGPVIMYSEGAAPVPITSDGIDYFLSNLQAPEDSSAFIFRQDGHVIYHINFYTDNVSLFYDFNTQKFFHASDENGNYFIGFDVAFFDNQYYMLSKNDGNLYAFDTTYTTYNGAIIPQSRTCKNIRKVEQDYFIATDIGFTIESGATNYQVQTIINPQDGNVFFITEDDDFLISEDGDFFITEDSPIPGLPNEGMTITSVPCIDFCISTDGGEHFSSDIRIELPAIGNRRNKLMWWQLGACNQLVCQFKFYGIGRFVVNDGQVSIRR